VSIVMMIALSLGCAEPAGSYAGQGLGGGTPPDRPHDILEQDDGVSGWHARGYNNPYLCLSMSGGSETCPDDVFPAVSQLSCDSAGCHGSYDYDPATSQASRALTGSAGPSCFTCHDKEWSDKKTGTGGGGGGEEDDDD
jgi:hypothetical protein